MSRLSTITTKSRRNIAAKAKRETAKDRREREAYAKEYRDVTVPQEIEKIDYLITKAAKAGKKSWHIDLSHSDVRKGPLAAALKKYCKENKIKITDTSHDYKFCGGEGCDEIDAFVTQWVLSWAPCKTCHQEGFTHHTRGDGFKYNNECDCLLDEYDGTDGKDSDLYRYWEQWDLDVIKGLKEKPY